MTRLGDSKTVRKGGRFARVMGTLWRSSKREKCGRAAMGLLLDIWSWCADQQEPVIPERAMRKLLAGDPNGRRQLRELVDAGFLDVVEGGHTPHDWDEHSGAPVSEMRRECDGLSDEIAASSVMKTPRGIAGESPVPRARAFSQNPEPRTQNPRESERESASARPVAVVSGANPLDALEADFATCRKALRLGFSRRWEAAQQPGMWTESGSVAVDQLAQWIQSLDGNRQVGLDRMLDTFFADEWVRSKHFPIDHLAKHKLKYFEPRVAPSGPANANGRETVASVRAEMDRAGRAGDYDLANTLKRKLDALERQLPENQPKWGNNGR